MGAVIVWLHYLPHWGATQDPGLKLACFCTGPAIRDAKANWISEIIATFFLILTMVMLDVLAGFIVTIISARKDLDFAGGT